MLFGCFFNSHFVFVSGKHISFLNACAFGFAVIIYSGFMVHTLDMFYEVKVKDDTHIEAMDDAEESFWIPLSRLNPDEFAFDSIRKGLHRYLETKLG